MTIEDECDIGTIDVEYERQLFDMVSCLRFQKASIRTSIIRR
jgi:hypothetical protein